MNSDSCFWGRGGYFQPPFLFCASNCSFTMLLFVFKSNCQGSPMWCPQSFSATGWNHCKPGHVTGCLHSNESIFYWNLRKEAECLGFSLSMQSHSTFTLSYFPGGVKREVHHLVPPPMEAIFGGRGSHRPLLKFQICPQLKWGVGLEILTWALCMLPS